MSVRDAGPPGRASPSRPGRRATRTCDRRGSRSRGTGASEWNSWASKSAPPSGPGRSRRSPPAGRRRPRRRPGRRRYRGPGWSSVRTGSAGGPSASRAPSAGRSDIPPPRSSSASKSRSSSRPAFASSWTPGRDDSWPPALCRGIPAAMSEAAQRGDEDRCAIRIQPHGRSFRMGWNRPRPPVHARPRRRRQAHSTASRAIRAESSGHRLQAGVVLTSGGPTIRGSRSIIAERSFDPPRTLPPDCSASRRNRSWSGSGFCCSVGSSRTWTSSDELSTCVLFS